MFISEIHIRSFRHLENIHLGSFAIPSAKSDLVVLAGPNGGGKSSILELLGFALSNSWSLSWELRRSFPSNAFEVAISLTSEERRLVLDHINNKNFGYSEEVFNYLESKGTYYRSFNYSEGEYQKNATLYNQIHQLVTNALRNHYNRSLGFFLKSDRSYPPQGFRRESIFEYEQKTQRDWVWSMAFRTSDIQYSDMYEFLVQQRYHYFRRLGAYHHNSEDRDVTTSPPSDPLRPYDELLQKLFPGYKFADANEEVPSNLFIQIPSGELISFSDLSSGEKEVFFILSFFLRHDVTNAVIVIDEPEMHLHPELARLLIRTMQSIRPGNQIWLATHNPEIIDEAGRDRVTYIARDAHTRKAVVTPSKNESEAIQNLRDLFGYSGYIGIAKRLVFLEGEDTSSDRKLFSSLFPEQGNRVKFVPALSTENLPRLNAAILSILESNLGWLEFYLIRDHDFLTDALVEHYRQHTSGRLYVLKRYHIENYLLDDNAIATVQKDIFSQLIKPEVVRQSLLEIARNMVGEVLRDMVAYQLNLVYRPQDFSLGKMFQGQRFLSSDSSWDIEKVEAFRAKLLKQVEKTNSSLNSVTSETEINRIISESQVKVEAAVSDESNGWRTLFPGRKVLEEYSRKYGLGEPIVLQNSLIKHFSNNPESIPEELSKVIHTISNGERF
jgi:predicted ATPase